MPIYEYKCRECNHEDEHYQSIRSEPLNICPVCNAPAYQKVPSLTHTDLKEFHKPIEMYSVAVQDPAEIRKLKTECPDADISDDPNHPLFGVPVARTRRAKLQVLKASGFQEINSERVRR